MNQRFLFWRLARQHRIAVKIVKILSDGRALTRCTFRHPTAERAQSQVRGVDGEEGGRLVFRSGKINFDELNLGSKIFLRQRDPDAKRVGENLECRKFSWSVSKKGRYLSIGK